MRENASAFSKTTSYECESYSNPVTFISRSKDLYVKFTSKSNGEMADGFKMFYVTFEGEIWNLNFYKRLLKGGVHSSAHVHESKYFFAFARYDPSLFNLIRCLCSEGNR